MSRILSHLPDFIEIDGVKLVPYVGGLKQREVIEKQRHFKKRYRQVKVLHPNLRQRTDLHGQPYKPTQWVFIEL
jgi:hypothetical protein